MIRHMVLEIHLKHCAELLEKISIELCASKFREIEFNEISIWNRF